MLLSNGGDANARFNGNLVTATIASTTGTGRSLVRYGSTAGLKITSPNITIQQIAIPSDTPKVSHGMTNAAEHRALKALHPELAQELDLMARAMEALEADAKLWGQLNSGNWSSRCDVVRTLVFAALAGKFSDDEIAFIWSQIDIHESTPAKATAQETHQAAINNQLCAIKATKTLRANLKIPIPIHVVQNEAAHAQIRGH